MNRSLFSAAISIFFGRFGSVALSIVITPVLVRLLGSGSYGDYAFVISTLAIVANVVNFGIADGIRKFIAEDRDIDGWKGLVFGFYFKFALGTLSVSVFFLLLLDATGVLSVIIGPTLSEYVIVFCLLLIANQLETVSRNTLMGLGLERISEPLKIIRRVIFGVTAVVLVLLGTGAWGALFGQVLSFGLIGIIMFFFIAKEINWRTILQSTPETVPTRRLIYYNTWTVLFIILSTTLYNIDVVFLRLLVNDEAAGLYNGALVIAEFLLSIPLVLRTLLVHSTSNLWLQQKSDHISKLASDLTRYTILATLLPIIGLASLADVFVPLYLGPEFSAVVFPVLLLLPGIFGFSVSKPIYGIGQGKGELRPLVLATGLAAILNLILNIVLIPRYEMVGAAVATSIGYGSMGIFHLVTARYIGFNPLQDIRIMKCLKTVLLSTIVIFGLKIFIFNPIIRLLVIPPVGFITYISLAYMTGAINEEEFNRIIEVIRVGLEKIKGMT